MKNLVSAAALAFLLWSCGGDKGTNNPPPQVPTTPNAPSPAHQATGQEISLTLTWQCSHPLNDSLEYDVYLGTSNTPPFVTSVYGIASYQTGQLANATIYYWKIAARDKAGHVTNGPVWSFTTVGNRAPLAATSPSPQHLLQGKEYAGTTFSWICSDPDGDALTYDLYFGSTTTPQLVKSALSSPQYVTNGLDWFHTLDYNHTYYWQVVARDDSGLTTAGPVWSFTTHHGVTLTANLRNIGSITDIALNGNQAILVQYGAQLISVDVSNPAAPNVRDELNLDVSSVDVYGGFAYANTPGWLYVVDISNPSDIHWVATHRMTGQTSGGAVRVFGNRVFASSGSTIDIFTIVSPSSLALSGTLSGPRAVYGDFFAVGNIVYVGAWGKVLDITNLSNPIEVITPIPWLHYLYQDYEMSYDNSHMYAVNGYLYSIDASSPRVPVVVDSMTFPQGQVISAHSCVFARSELVYVATRHAMGPLIVYDATDPSNLILHAWYSRVGTWGEAVVTNDTHVFVAASGEGLLVLQITP